MIPVPVLFPGVIATVRFPERLFFQFFLPGRLPETWSRINEPLKGVMAEGGWDYAEGLKQTKTARVCMTCQHFSCATDRHCHTLLTCSLQRRLVPHGERLTKKCRNWMVRREQEIGWCPEVA